MDGHAAPRFVRHAPADNDAKAGNGLAVRAKILHDDGMAMSRISTRTARKPARTGELWSSITPHTLNTLSRKKVT
ncbi:hypothetical protein [Streptosporangium sp. KLBMP 9127]|nr:hypothetical protein [Streptosporangium sp. KLBMP 9127]